MRKFFKRGKAHFIAGIKYWWKCLGESIEEEEEQFPPSFSQKEKDNSAWCPFCGYSGSSDELRCHLLNYHKR